MKWKLSLLMSVVVCFLLSGHNVAVAEAMCSNSSSSSVSGTITDSGGSSGKYSNNEDCGFLIQPSSGTSITISFSSFRVESFYDKLRVYDGSSTSGTLLATLDGNSLPSDYTASSGAMYLRFTSDNNVKKSGFVAAWSVSGGSSSSGNRLCVDTSSTEPSGTLTDSGGASSNYSNDENCSFLIQPSTGEVTLDISDFDTESFYDKLYVYDGTNSSATLLASPSGSQSALSYTSSGGALYLLFDSDYSNTDDGLEATWSTSDPGVCSATSESVADSFNSVSYDLNTGSKNWTTGWTEDGESDGPSAGLLRVNNSLCSSGNCLRLGVVSGSSAQTFSDYFLYRQADLSNTSNATLTYTHRRGHAQGSVTVTTWISDDGGSSWTQLKQVISTSSSFSGTNESIDISSYATSNTVIRFEVDGTNAISGFYIDNIDISYDQECSSDTPDEFLISHDNQAAYCLNESMSVTARASGSVLETYTGSMVLDTQSGIGTWAVSSGSGTLVDGTADDGIATYTFDSTDNGVASFTLYASGGASSIDIDVYDGSVRDDDSEGNLSFSATGFSITASPLSNPPVTPINDPLSNQTSGQSFSVSVAAYGTDPDSGSCGIIETYTGNKTLSVATQYSNPTSGTLSASGGGTVNFVSGQATFTSQYNDVGQIILSVTDSSAGIAGQSNNFVVLPDDFSIVVSDSSGTSNPGTTDSGDGFTISGQSFRVNVQALNALDQVTPNYGNELVAESVILSINSLVFPLGGNVGALAHASTFTKISSDTFQNASVSWDEVGSIRLQAAVADGDYLGAGDVNSAASETVGRFYPDNFFLGTQSVTNACTSFTYLSQPSLSLSYTLSALNQDGDVTTNYDTGLGYPIGTIQHHAELDNAGTDLGSRLSTTTPLWSAGEYTLIDTSATFARASSREAPLSALLFGVSIDDIDDRTLNSLTMNPSANDDCVTGDTCTAGEIGSATFYFGRVSLSDAYGPETAVLPAKFQTEYWDGQEFVVNTIDSCTLIPRANIEFNNTAISSTPALSVDLSGGTTTAQFSLLDSTNIGFLSGDAGLEFSAPGVDISTKSFSVDVDLTTMAWLRSDWNQDGNDDNDTALPTATMSFKTYRGHDRILYWKHKY